MSPVDATILGGCAGLLLGCLLMALFILIEERF